MKYLILLISLCSPFLMYGQALDLPDEDDLPSGRHYRFATFHPGILVLRTGQEVETELNYNLVTEEIVVFLNDVRAPYPTIHLVDKVYIKDVEFMYREDDLFEVLNRGVDPLLVRRKQIVTQIGQQTGLGRTVNQNDLRTETRLQDMPIVYQMKLPNRFVLRDVNLYFLLKKGELVPLRNFKKLAKLYPSAGDIKSFVQNEKLSFDAEEDIIRAIQFCLEH